MNRQRPKFNADIKQVLTEYPTLVIYEEDSEIEESILKIKSVDEKGVEFLQYSISVIEYPAVITIYNHLTEDLQTTSGTIYDLVTSLINENSNQSKSDTDISFSDDEDSLDYENTNMALSQIIRGNPWDFYKELKTDLEILRKEIDWLDVEPSKSEMSGSYEIKIVFSPSQIINLITAEAWNIKCDLPITVIIRFNDGGYLVNKNTPRIEIFQKDSKEQTGIRFQLEGIMSEFLREVFFDVSKIEHHPVGFDDPLVIELIEMGFEPGDAEKAVRISRNREDSVSWILTNNQSIAEQKSSSGFSLLSALLGGTTKTTKADTLKIDPLVMKVRSKKQKEKNESPKLEINPPDIGDKIPHSFIHKGLVDLRHGFLYSFMTYLLSRFKNLNQFCVICDQPHVFGMNNMLKPTVCSRPLCCFSYQQMGVAKDLVDYISSSAEVVDLLIVFARLAAKSSRHKLIFDPFPHLIDPINEKNLVLDPQNPDFNLAVKMITKIPEMDLISNVVDLNDMKIMMEKDMKHSYNLLQWIITSNRSHIVKLSEANQIKSMKSPHQFLMLSQPPEKEAEFAKLKKKYGSCFAFHGSPNENWHAILRHGLKNASGTKWQINGAAYGNGIYLSPSSGTSLGYARISSIAKKEPKINNRFLQTDDIYCIAICEVINKDIQKSNGDIWVMPYPEYVCTRFLIVYDSYTIINCNSITIADEIQQTINFYQI